MKQIKFFIFCMSAIVFFTACGNKQKPSPRQQVWGNNTVDTTMTVKKVELKGDKVLVPFKRNSGDLAEVQVSLNGVPFNVWWDTGASMTCISSLEFVKLMKEGKISDDDYVGNVGSTIADGSSTVEKVYKISEIFILGQDNEHYLRLNDVYVAVAENLGAPLLLGQNVIKELPAHTFDDNKEIIIFDKQ